MLRTRFPSIVLSTLLVTACGSEDRTVEPDPNTEPTVAELISINIDAGGITHEVGSEITVTAMGVYDDASKKDLTPVVSWGVGDNTLLELVDERPNVFVARAEGRVSLTAGLGTISKTTELSLTPARLTALEIIPSTGDIGKGAVLVVSVVGTYSDGSRETITEDVEFETDASSVLFPSANDPGRLVTFGTLGTANITASLSGIRAMGTYTVGPVRIANIQVTPNGERIGDTPMQFNANGYWTDETRSDVTTTVQWTSSDPSVVAIDANGLATRVADGEVVITASSNEVEGAVRLRTLGASVCGSYPESHAAGVAYDRVLAPMFWRDALDQEGNPGDFFLEDLPCDTENYQTVLFVIGTGWCPYCPAFKHGIDAMQAELDAAGMRVVYVENQTDSGSPASNMSAHTIVSRTLSGTTNSSMRIGDADAEGGASLPFHGIVQYYPYAVVVRTNDMHVIAAGQSHNWMSIATDPDRLYGVN